jgi:hypothetical protein
MSLTRIDLSGNVCVENGCTELNFSDTTGFLESACADDQNDLGYGLVGGIALNDVTSAILNVYYPDMTTPIKFTFTIVNGTITACTLTNLNLVAYDIYSKLVSLDFPLLNFNIALDYGVKIPKVVDGLYTWDYTISGSSSGTPFNYTTSGSFISTCEVNCCTSKAYLELEADCGCSDLKMLEIIKQEVFLNAANYAMNVGMDDKASSFITRATEICDNKCKDC